MSVKEIGLFSSLLVLFMSYVFMLLNHCQKGRRVCLLPILLLAFVSNQFQVFQQYILPIWSPLLLSCSLLLILQVMLLLSYFSMLLKYYCKSLCPLVVTLLTYLPKMLICCVQLCYHSVKKCLYTVTSYTGLVYLLLFTFKARQLVV